MVDVNQQWTVKQAIASTRALAPYRPYWLEDATSNADFDGLRQVSEALEIPTCAGETYYTMRRSGRSSKTAASTSSWSTRTSGCRLLKVAHMAEVYGLKVVPHLATESWRT